MYCVEKQKDNKFLNAYQMYMLRVTSWTAEKSNMVNLQGAVGYSLKMNLYTAKNK